MPLPTRIDHVQQGLEKLNSNWDDKPYAKGLLQSLLEEYNSLEDVLFQLLEERGIYEAVGVNLDNIGSLFGLDREGRTDDQYRSEILKRISVLETDGTTEKFMQVMRVTTGSDFVDFWEHNSGYVHARLGSGFNPLTWEYLQSFVAAGVHLRIDVDYEFDSFVASETTNVSADLQTNLLEDIQVFDGTDTSDLQVQTQDIALGANSFAILPEEGDPDFVPLAELLFTKVYVVTGSIIDNAGDYIVDDEGNILTWLNYEF